MDSRSNWYDGIAKQINQLKDTLSERDYKKYKLRLLLCVAERVAEFSPELITQPESFMVDGVIFMYLQNIENPLVFKPGIQIRKMRGVEHTKDILRLGFTKDGIRIL